MLCDATPEQTMFNHNDPDKIWLWNFQNKFSVEQETFWNIYGMFVVFNPFNPG